MRPDVGPEAQRLIDSLRSQLLVHTRFIERAFMDSPTMREAFVHEFLRLHGAPRD